MAYEPKQDVDLTDAPKPRANTDYYSVLKSVIEIVMKDPAQMRSMVYQLARMTLQREGRSQFPPMRGSEIKQHLEKLDAAIARVELDAQVAALADHVPPAQIADERETPEPREIVVLPERPSLAQTSRVFSVAETKPGFWSGGTGHFGFSFIGLLQLFAASFVGVAIFAFLTGQLEFHGKRAPEAPVAQPAPAPIIVQVPAPPPGPALPFPMPANYGIYAVNDGQLVELDRMPMRMPDPRVMLSPDISMPVRIVVPDGKPTFVIYRRDLANNAPTQVPARVVARVARELSFKSGKAIKTEVANIWRVRNIAYDLRVAPVAGNGEMIMITPDANTELPAGRYALVLNGLGYDFTVGGTVTNPEQCLEKSETTGASIYTDCPKP